ncbi:hypothetical protein NE686_17260 [Tissierella carlieri]|uniref:Uncharacterized protein n=1 Tax=Tissierella carlieri TaxID=689904 RepID=A0ABT1SEL4_9FIRM|nr:hypothetical protein [Tissierella carlieri]MCQ4924854.1 hypothetical protein [Tissierella carlieri]
MKRIISLLLAVTITIGLVIASPISVYAATYNYRGFVNKHATTKQPLRKPTAGFSVELLRKNKNGSYEVIDRASTGSKLVTLNAQKGDRLRFTDNSKAEVSGSSIKFWDWQVYAADGSYRESDYYSRNPLPQSFELRNATTYNFFLNVADNQPIDTSIVPEEFFVDNWSENGPHSTETKPDRLGRTWTWYFAHLRVNVSDVPTNPDPDPPTKPEPKPEEPYDPPPPFELPDSDISVKVNIDWIEPEVAPEGTMVEGEVTFTISSSLYAIKNYKIVKGSTIVEGDAYVEPPRGTTTYIKETRRMRFQIGRDVAVRVLAYDVMGAWDDDEDSVRTESIKPDIDVTSQIIGLPESADYGQLVDGYYEFTASSTVYPLNKWYINSGFDYVQGVGEGNFRNRNNETIRLPIQVPAGKTIYMGVTALDEGGYSRSHGAEAFVRVKEIPTINLNVLTPEVMYKEDAKFSVTVNENDYSIHRYKWYINPVNDPTGRGGSVKSGEGIIPSVMEMDIPKGEYKVIQEGYYYDSTGERKVSDIKSITVIPSLEAYFIAVPYKQVVDKDMLLVNKSKNYTSEKWWIKPKGSSDVSYEELNHSNYYFNRPVGEYTIKLEVFNPNLRVNYASTTRDVEFLGIPVVDFLLAPDLLFVNEISVITDLSEHVTNKMWWIKDVKSLRYVPFIDLKGIGNDKYEFTKENYEKFKDEGKEEYTIKLTADGRIVFDVSQYVASWDRNRFESLTAAEFLTPPNATINSHMAGIVNNLYTGKFKTKPQYIEDSVIWTGPIESIGNEYRRKYTFSVYVVDEFLKEKTAIFKYPTPVADMSIVNSDGEGVVKETKIYKKLTLTGEYESIIATNAKDIDILMEGRTPTNYPIRFDSKYTRFRIKPISVFSFNPERDIETDKKITVEDGVAYIIGESETSIRINNPGVYEISYQVYNGKNDSDFKQYHLSDWSTPKKINVQPDLDPIVEDIQIVTTNYHNLTRDFDNKKDLKTEVELDVILSSLDDDYIDINNTVLMFSYDKNNDGVFSSDDRGHLKQYIWLDDNITDVYKEISSSNKSFFEKLEIEDSSSTTEKYVEKIEVMQLANHENRYIKLRVKVTISNSTRNILGNFKVEAKTAKKLKDNDWIEEPKIKAPIANFGEYSYNDSYKVNAVENFYQSIKEPRTGDSSLIHLSNKKFTIINNAPAIENIMKREKFLEIWIAEAGTNPFTQGEIKSLLTQFKNNGIISRIGVISSDGKITKYDLDMNGEIVVVE